MAGWLHTLAWPLRQLTAGHTVKWTDKLMMTCERHASPLAIHFLLHDTDDVLMGRGYVKLCSQHTNWTKLQFANYSYEYRLSNGRVHSGRTDWAPTVLVSLQPIKSWRRRAWSVNVSCKRVDLLQVSYSVHLLWMNLKSTATSDDVDVSVRRGV